MPEIRPLVSPLHKAVFQVVENALSLPVGDSQAPDCDPPYAMIMPIVGAGLTGTLSDPEADGMPRYQLTGVGTAAEQANLIRDDIRKGFTRDALNDQLRLQSISGDTDSNRKVLRCWIDVSASLARAERGLPEPYFSAFDQYLMMTTPHEWS